MIKTKYSLQSRNKRLGSGQGLNIYSMMIKNCPQMIKFQFHHCVHIQIMRKGED